MAGLYNNGIRPVCPRTKTGYLMSRNPYHFGVIGKSKAGIFEVIQREPGGRMGPQRSLPINVRQSSMRMGGRVME